MRLQISEALKHLHLKNAGCGLVLQPGTERHQQKFGNFLGAEFRRQFAQLRAELHVPLHLLTSIGHREDEAQSDDASSIDQGRAPGIRRMKLACAKAFRHRGIERAPQKSRKVLHRPDLRSLRLGSQIPNAHILDHADVNRNNKPLATGRSKVA